MSRFKRGDHVCFAPAFIRAVGLQDAPEAHMRGTVQVIRLGAHERHVATVQFSGGTFREVLVKNLSPVNPDQWITI